MSNPSFEDGWSRPEDWDTASAHVYQYFASWKLGLFTHSAAIATDAFSLVSCGRSAFLPFRMGWSLSRLKAARASAVVRSLYLTYGRSQWLVPACWVGW